MRDLRYKVWTTRLSSETLQELKKKKEESGLSWNLFIKHLLALLSEDS